MLQSGLHFREITGHSGRNHLYGAKLEAGESAGSCSVCPASSIWLAVIQLLPACALTVSYREMSECFKTLFNFFPFPLLVDSICFMWVFYYFLSFSEYIVTKLSTIYSKVLSINVQPRIFCSVDHTHFFQILLH